MSRIRNYLMPDYFSEFHCKMGACRSACCEGWPVSFSMADYFKLLGVECSPALRRKLDCAMHLSEHPSPEAYAQITPRYDGKCPMHMEDGRCALHTELGDGALAAVCRLYPRGVHVGDVNECACANSCEAVVELLMRAKPVDFVEAPMEFSEIQPQERRFHFESAGREQAIRLWLIAFIQNRTYTLPQRLQIMGRGLEAMERALIDHDERKIDALLTGAERFSAPEETSIGHEELCFGLTTANHMLEILDERSDSIREYGQAALDYFGQGETEFDQYVKAREHFEKMIPEWESWFENMLVNHMFFVQFPFQDRPVDFKEEFLALCAVYVLLRFLCVGWTATRETVSSAVDVAAAAFRLIDHTEFDRYAVPIFRRLGCTEWNRLHRLVCL